MPSIRKKHPELRLDKSGACIEILVLSVEGLSAGKDKLSFTDFNFMNETLDLNEEIETVAEVGEEEPSKDEKFLFSAMESMTKKNKRISMMTARLCVVSKPITTILTTGAKAKLK